MSESKRFISRFLLSAMVLVAALFLASAAPAACTGTWTDYYDSSAFLEIVGTKVSCPGFPDQIDTDPDGNYTETSFFIAEEIDCPCGGGGGGGGGGDQGEQGEN